MAWVLDLLTPLVLSTLILLIVYTPSRALLFPPAPLALVSSKDGGVKKPQSGVLGSEDTATGAPENYKGEAAEAEARNFVRTIATVVVASVSGKHPQTNDDQDGGIHDSVPDPTEAIATTTEAQEKAGGQMKTFSHDKTRVPMETAVWTMVRPIMHGLANVSDTYERIANALSPTPPFPRQLHRLRLATIVAPVLALSFFLTSYMFVKGVTFTFGFILFGDPIIQPAYQLLNRKFPNWQKLLELRK